MRDYVDVMNSDDIKDGQMKEVAAGGTAVVVARAAGEYYAAGARCPHMGARLVEGTLDGTIITCPRHGSQFDLRDGSVVRWTNWPGIVASVGRLIKSPEQLSRYRVKVEGGRVLVEV
jgi:3-phenylpropionate/trans-cinnamate dioxygenase ferredoxin component